MNKYEIIDSNTGEIVEFETSVDIDLLEQYNQWVVENKLNQPTFDPKEFALYKEREAAVKNVKRAISMIEQYRNVEWPVEMVDSLLGILRDEE